MEFFITLPSNVVSYSDKNTIGNYTTKLALRISLEGNWEVGLKEISYTKSWFNITEDQHAFCYDKSTKTITGSYFILEKGYYENIDKIFDKLSKTNFKYSKNGSWTNYEVMPSFAYNNVSNTIMVTNGVTTMSTVEGSENCRIFFSPELAEILGYKGSKEIFSLIAKHPLKLTDELDAKLTAYISQELSSMDFTGGHHSLMVYCDLADPVHVGDTLAKLLRVVEIPGSTKHGEQVVITYDNPIFVSLLKKDFESIEIDIKDDAGVTVPFMFGRSIVTLQFRKK